MIDSLSTSDEILTILAQVEELLEQGHTLERACHRLRVPAETYRLWRRAHSRTFLAASRRLEALERAHARMIELVTDQQQEIQHLHRQLALRSPAQALG